MTNEELALLIQQGETERMHELWGQVEKFVRMKANALLMLLPPHSPVEFDDLLDSGYIALDEAVKYYDPSRGAKLLTVLTYCLKTSFAEAFGGRSVKQRRDPLHRARSADAHIFENDDGSALTLMETFTDTTAEEAFEDAEREVFLDQLSKALDYAFDSLSTKQVDLIHKRYYQCQTLQAVADSRGVTKETVRQAERYVFKILRNPAFGLRAFASPWLERKIHKETNYYYHVSAHQFGQTGSSAVEEIVMRRESKRGAPEERDRETDRMLADFDAQIEAYLSEHPELREKYEEIQQRTLEAPHSFAGGDSSADYYDEVL